MSLHRTPLRLNGVHVIPIVTSTGGGGNSARGNFEQEYIFPLGFLQNFVLPWKLILDRQFFFEKIDNPF